MAKVKCEPSFTQLNKLNVTDARKLTVDGNEVPVINPDYYTDCSAATYVSSSQFTVVGNQVNEFQQGRKVQLDSGQSSVNCNKPPSELTPDDIFTVNKYDYSVVSNSSFDGVNTVVNIVDSILTDKLQEVCLSIEWPSNLDVNTINLGAAVRRSAGAGGEWSLIEDSGHAAIGISSVTEPDDYTYRLNYDTASSKVGTILSVIDAELSPYGIHTGASGGTSNATFNMFAPCTLYVNGVSSVSASPLWTSQTGPIVQTDAATLQITHANRSLAVDPPMISNVVPSAGSFHDLQYEVSWGATTTTIKSLSYIKGFCQSDGVNVTLNFSPNLNISVSNIGGVITITHDNVAGDYIPQLTAFNSPLRPEINSITDTSISVQFRDSSGSVVGSLSSDMNFYFTRQALVPSAMDPGVRFGIDLGLCRVKNDDVGNISLNNFWIIGFNNR